ncbi:ABC transporter transmembrane domain-containing protein [Prochlorococcus marinus]|nr:ABC transporter transmembrane domain-containing protein [Prochlorococcus marinus]
MDKDSYFKNLDLDKEIIKIIEKDIFLENYSVGEEIFNPEITINKVSIILSGSIRQIKRDSTNNTNIYKYVKNDFLFIPELIYKLKNSFYYIAANDLQLISIEKEKFLNLLKENNEFRKWINNQIFKNEKISILNKLLKEEFNNNFDKEQLLNNLSENIDLVNEKILKNIQDKKIDSKNFEIISISKSIHFDYLEKINFEKILGLDFSELERLVIINNKFKKFKIHKNKIPKVDKISQMVEESIDESKKELHYADINIKKNVCNRKDNVIECFRILSKLIDINYRVDPISNYLDFLDKNKKKYTFRNYAEIAYGLGLEVSCGELSISQVLKVKTPSLIIYKNDLALVVNADREKLTLIYPADGLITLYKNDLEKIYEGNINIINISKNRLTQENKFSISWFIPILKEYKNTLFQILISGLVVQIFILSNPLLIQVIIDKVISQRSLDTLQVLGFALLVITVIEAVLSSIKSFILSETTNRIDQKLGIKIIDHLFRLPLEYYDKRSIGELSNRVGELEKIRNFLTSQGINTFLDASFSLFYIFVLFLYSGKLTLIALSVIPIQILITYYGSPLFKKQYRKAAINNANTQSYLVEVLSGIQTVKTQNAETSSRWRWQNYYSKFIKSTYQKTITAVSLNQLTQSLQKISQLIVLWYGAIMVLNGEFTLGQLIAFRIISGYVTQPILRLSTIWQQYQEIKISFERLGDIVNTPKENESKDLGKIQLPSVEGNILFDNVSFKFIGDSKTTLNKINCQIDKNSFVGIVGKSGSGKSTFCKLISRLYVPNEGSILIDKYDIQKVEISSIRRQLGIVSQDPLLFAGTIRDNICFGDESFSDKEIVEASKICCAHEFIMELPLGYNTKISEKGSSLSGGQRQRIALVRALLKKPKIIILDEATSALDIETEQLFVKNLLNKFKNSTIIIITHRLSNVINADKILVFEKGDLSEQGDHESLLKNKSVYYSLLNNEEK